MRHLIIGAGVMGKRHGGVLESLGDEVVYLDIGFTLDDYSGTPFSSILICTPPDTHRYLIDHFKGLGLPMFVEKPVVTDATPISYPGISMVACNWRWCTCWNKRTIICSYPTAEPLDLIHFLDLFWQRRGKPSDAQVTLRSNGWELNANGYSAILLRGQESSNPSSHNCDMFIKQMIDWQRVIHGHKSWNSVEMATERTHFLMALLTNAEPLKLQSGIELSKWGA